MNKVRFNRLVKVLLIALAVVLLGCVSVFFVACKHDEHSYKSEIIVQPTCSNVGEIKYTCEECGDFYTEELPVIDHELIYTSTGDEHWQVCKNCNYESSKVKHDFNIIQSSAAATCHSTGIAIKACLCGNTAIETLEMTNHTFTVLQKNVEGHWYKCADCSATTEVEDHKFSISVSQTPSTCIESGSKVTKCDCGETHTELLPLANHSYSKTAFDSDGHWSVCSVCNSAEPNQSKVPHDKSIVSVEPDCVKSGSVTTTCNGCEYIDVVTVKALGHDFDRSQFTGNSTNSGHYYKCNRCGESLPESHTLVDCECPDGYNREATCYRTGHRDQICEVCQWRTHSSIPMTNEHNFVAEWTSNGTFHWHVCVNGDGACDAHGEEAAHIWQTKRVEPTCSENGSEWRECSVCAQKQSGSNKIIPAGGHDYQTVEVITEPTCTQSGEELLRCKTCGDETTVTIKALGHTMSAYNMELTDVSGHYRQCSVCGYTNMTSKNHTWSDKVVQQATTCGEYTVIEKTCDYCHFTYEQKTLKQHSYITLPDSYVDATCDKYGSHVEKCDVCGDVRTVEDTHLGYADHNLVYYPKKDMTNTEPGNINYWQCKSCGRYFTSKDCHKELTADQIFTYPPKIIEVNKIDDFVAIAEGIESEQTSYDIYKLTAEINTVNQATIVLIDSQSKITDFSAEIPLNVNVNSLREGQIVTLQGRLFVYREDNETIYYLTEVEILSIEGDESEYDLYIEVTGFDSSYGYIDVSYAGNVYSTNYKYFNVLIPEIDNELTVTLYKYNPNATLYLVKVTVNGQPCTVQNGVLDVTITGDTHIVMQFATKSPITSVTLNAIDTSTNNNEHIVNEYVSYCYQNGANEYGRLYQNSKLTFNVNNANIVGINITYDAEYLESNPEILNNVIKAVKPNGNVTVIEQSAFVNKGKVVITLSFDDGYSALEYFASASQARVTEITVLYQTNNTI